VAISLVFAVQDALANEVLCPAFNQRRKQFNVVAWALTGEDLFKPVAERQPDIAVISATLQDEPTAGLRALRELGLTRSSK